MKKLSLGISAKCSNNHGMLEVADPWPIAAGLVQSIPSLHTGHTPVVVWKSLVGHDQKLQTGDLFLQRFQLMGRLRRECLAIVWNNTQLFPSKLVPGWLLRYCLPQSPFSPDEALTTVRAWLQRCFLRADFTCHAVWWIHSTEQMHFQTTAVFLLLAITCASMSWPSQVSWWVSLHFNWSYYLYAFKLFLELPGRVLNGLEIMSEPWFFGSGLQNQCPNVPSLVLGQYTFTIQYPLNGFGQLGTPGYISHF